eukprot:1353943-Amphidinium_carterae.1
MDHAAQSNIANVCTSISTRHVLAATAGRKLMLGTTWQDADITCIGTSTSSAPVSYTHLRAHETEADL